MFGESNVKQNPFQSSKENLSDTYHDPSHRVPGIYYWNPDPPFKKRKNIKKLEGGYF
jgi:hypothetical protein